ncbi:MAG TPA: nucleotide excision repair endonuclease [Vicinamibacterales bacterium]|jgi:predicted GIY-YIG superfamily endonuclease|nr:nucleotide excision repair endonuclease [Vicinamibacterales bacterium]
MLRDKLLARLSQTADPDYAAIAAEILGIRNAPPALARRLVRQALVVEDREAEWARAGERIVREAPAGPGVYVLRDADGQTLYVGKANNLRRRLRTHFAGRRWRAIKVEMARAADAEWQEVGSELEALLREASLIRSLRPVANVQVGEPALATRGVPRALVRDVIVVLPSVEADSAELVAARADGGWLLQRTRRSGADLAVHGARLWRFFNSPLRHERAEEPALAPIVFSWLAHRGGRATRLDPHDAGSVRVLRARLAALLSDARLFEERLDQR